MALLEGKVAVITGAARGIGAATAGMLAEHGAQILVCDLDAEAAEATAGSLGGGCAAFAGDVTEEDVPEAIVRRALEEWGRIDILVNNAGYALDAPAHKVPDDWFQRMLDIHAVAPFRMCRAVAQHWREAAKAELADGREVHRKIVNVSSVSGTMGNAAQVTYASGKAAVVGLTKTLAKEWGRFNINVNAVAFGFIETRMTRPTTGETAEISGAEVRIGIPEGFRDSLMSKIALGRFGRPEEAAGGVVFLCSPWSDYVTGQLLTINGGYQMGMTE